MPAVDYLDLTTRFTAESDRNVWTALNSSLAYVNRVIPAELRGSLAALVRHRLAEKVSLLGWEVQEKETELDRQLRGDLLRTIGTIGDHEHVQARAREAYARYREDESSLDANVLPAVIAILAAAGASPSTRSSGTGSRAPAPRRKSSVTCTPSPASVRPSSSAERSRWPSTVRSGARTRRT
jgi:hypothetical protein